MVSSRFPSFCARGWRNCRCVSQVQGFGKEGEQDGRVSHPSVKQRGKIFHRDLLSLEGKCGWISRYIFEELEYPLWKDIHRDILFEELWMIFFSGEDCGLWPHGSGSQVGSHHVCGMARATVVARPIQPCLSVVASAIMIPPMTLVQQLPNSGRICILLLICWFRQQSALVLFYGDRKIARCTHTLEPHSTVPVPPSFTTV